MIHEKNNILYICTKCFKYFMKIWSYLLVHQHFQPRSFLQSSLVLQWQPSFRERECSTHALSNENCRTRPDFLRKRSVVFVNVCVNIDPPIWQTGYKHVMTDQKYFQNKTHYRVLCLIVIKNSLYLAVVYICKFNQPYGQVI